MEAEDFALPIKEMDSLKARITLVHENPDMYRWLLGSLNDMELPLEEKDRMVKVAAAVHYVIFNYTKAEDISAMSLSDQDIEDFLSDESDGF